jgi:hypothetical protein
LSALGTFLKNMNHLSTAETSKDVPWYHFLYQLVEFGDFSRTKAEFLNFPLLTPRRAHVAMETRRMKQCCSDCAIFCHLLAWNVGSFGNFSSYIWTPR